jgi:hypothetical protein
LVTYDDRLAHATRANGVHVTSPTAGPDRPAPKAGPG